MVCLTSVTTAPSQQPLSKMAAAKWQELTHLATQKCFKHNLVNYPKNLYLQGIAVILVSGKERIDSKSFVCTFQTWPQRRQRKTNSIGSDVLPLRDSSRCVYIGVYIPFKDQRKHFWRKTFISGTNRKQYLTNKSLELMTVSSVFFSKEIVFTRADKWKKNRIRKIAIYKLSELLEFHLRLFILGTKIDLHSVYRQTRTDRKNVMADQAQEIR